jgi:hypothetical protein
MFTGTPVVKKVSGSLYRVTGLSLAAGAVGTIGLAGGTGEVDILDAPEWGKFGDVSLQDAVEVSIVAVEGGDAYALWVEKSGATQADFLVTIGNDAEPETVSPGLEIWLRFH